MAPSPSYRQKQLMIAEHYRQRHLELASMISKLGAETVDAEEVAAERIDELLRLTAGVGWQQSIMRLYILFGMLEHSARELARGLTPARRHKVEELFKSDLLEEYCRTALISEIEKVPGLASMLALYGRALVADALLEVKNSADLTSILPEDYDPESDLSHRNRAQFKALEPFTSELIAAHTVRMDRLGLTA